MDAIPIDWIDKIFNCMEQFYGTRWTSLFDKHFTQDFAKTIWKSGLIGLTKEQIRGALSLCRRAALNMESQPPHVMDFFKYSKGYTQPYIDYHPKANEVKSDPVVARNHLNDIRKKLNLRVSA